MFWNGTSCSSYLSFSSNSKTYKGHFSFSFSFTLFPPHFSPLPLFQIVIIPGPGDPASGILPSPPLSSVFFSSLSSILPSAVGMSNPCRMRYCTQNIVVFRDNLVNSMRRHCLIPPNRDLLPSLNQHVRISLFFSSQEFFFDFLINLPSSFTPSLSSQKNRW